MNPSSPIDSLLERITLEMQVLERADLREDLCVYINHLILNDFDKLVQLLYQVDVSEDKLKSMLSEKKGSDAADIIAELIILRQEEKLKSKKANPKRDDISEEDRWT